MTRTYSLTSRAASVPYPAPHSSCTFLKCGPGACCSLAWNAPPPAPWLPTPKLDAPIPGITAHPLLSGIRRSVFPVAGDWHTATHKGWGAQHEGARNGPQLSRHMLTPALTCGMKPQHVTVWKPNLLTCWGSAPSALRPTNRKRCCCLSLKCQALAPRQDRPGCPAGMRVV